MKSKYILPPLAFIFACLCGLFTAWIGNIRPFTSDAAVLSILTLLGASYVSLLFYMSIDD